MSLANTDQYRALFLNDVPMMDVRAPIEFNQGAFPTSVNVPLLDDAQREAVGTRYNEQGQDAAIALGWQLATPLVQAQRIESWLAFIQTYPAGYLYCFRGGLRSRLSQQLIQSAGIEYPLVTGGYKAMRRFLLEALTQASASIPLKLIGGRTGSGKTEVIRQLARSVDLEGLANHRGSAFGRQISPQPPQITFENRLSIALMKQQQVQSAGPLFVEDEGKLIGRVALPECFRVAMLSSPLVVLEASISDRVNTTLTEYVVDALPQYEQTFGPEQGFQRFRQQCLDSVDRIRKRLGGKRHQQLSELFREAFDVLARTGDVDAFRPGIQSLLVDYYDPMYDYQQNQREGRVQFRGDRTALLDWAQGSL